MPRQEGHRDADQQPPNHLTGFGCGFHPRRGRALAGQVLDLGAEVIKVEAPGGGTARQITSVLPGRRPILLPNNRGLEVEVD